MHPLRALVCYLVAVFALGAALAPGLYALAAWAGESVPFFAELAQKPFHRFVSRALLLVALAGLWPLLRGLGLRSWRELGLGNSARAWRDVGLGLAAGFGSLALVAALALACGARQWSGEVRLARLGSAALSAGVVAVLEELLFRGALFGGLRRAHGWPRALVVSSGVYALVHFFQRPAAPLEITWSSGFLVLAQMLRGFVEVRTLVPGFFTLALAGAILALAYQRTGALYGSMGLHAGWIFWLKSYAALTGARPGAGAWFWGSGKLIDGWLATAVLAALFAGLAWQTRTRSRPPAPAG